MGAFYTIFQGIGLTNLLQTLTHSLGMTPASLVCRVLPRGAANLTATAPTIVGSLGTNLVTVGIGVGTLMTCDVEVQFIPSIID